MRRRSLFTIPSYPTNSEDPSLQQYYSSIPDYCDVLPTEYTGEPRPSTSVMSFISDPQQPAAHICNSEVPSNFIEYPTYLPEINGQNYMGDADGAQYVDEENKYEDGADEDIQEVEGRVTPHGIISLNLLHEVRVDLTVDKAIRIVSYKNDIVLSLSADGSSAAFLHPNGRIHQRGSRVECVVYDSNRNNKYVKMWYKGVSFTSDQCAIVYLVDEGGVRTTNDKFSDLKKDPSISVFYDNSSHGPKYISDARRYLEESQFWVNSEKTLNFLINNVKVTQLEDGLVRVSRQGNKFLLRTSPSNGNALLTSHFLHCTASMGNNPHMFIRRGERRMHSDCNSFVVRNAGHSAGFDEDGQLKVY